MKHFALIALLAAGATCAGAGCATLTRAEIQLAEQARRGVALIAQHEEARDAAAAELHRLRRERIDRAFDEDVLERAGRDGLDPDWVLKARRAYAVALDAYAKAQSAEAAASASRRRILAELDAALERLQWLQSIRLNVEALGEEVSR